ncbi:MAG: ATP-binding cassette domain-containing protein [Burkholderiales bacterium]|nr:ATP-binding cassette domain-containing protein [Burkholderiales bacterium]
MAEPSPVASLPIVCSGGEVRIGQTRILSSINLTIEPGTSTFVIGPNGSGKSTLLRLLHGLLAPSQGAVTWGGRVGPPVRQAMVFQRAVLLRRSAAANIRYALRLVGIVGAEARKRIDDALAEVGLKALAQRSARVLSGGEQQRLALARAWALRPEVLFLDEPTASLDPKATRAVEDIVRGIHARGTTIVMSTHNLPQAKRLAGSVVFLDEGRLVEHSPAHEFFASPRTPEAAAFLEGERL